MRFAPVRIHDTVRANQAQPVFERCADTHWVARLAQCESMSAFDTAKDRLEIDDIHKVGRR